MNQNEILNYLCNSVKYFEKLQNGIKEQNRVENFEKPDKTIQQRIDECTQRLASDIFDLLTLFSQQNNGNPC